MAGMNREQWLTKAAALIARHLFGKPLPKVRVSCGFPATGATSATRRRIGECWKATVSDDETAEIFISPLLDDPLDVLSTLTHELIHAYHPDAGHKGEFVRMAKSVGFTAPWTSTPMSVELRDELNTKVLAKLPEYPHAKMNVSTKPKQSTRMLKAECPEDGYTVRLTQKWVDVGMPVCPCGCELELAG